MREPEPRRLLTAAAMLWVLSSTVPLVTTMLFAEWAGIERVLTVAFVPFLVNGLLGFMLLYWGAYRKQTKPEPTHPTDAD